MQLRIYKSTLIVYGAILLVSLALFYLLPKDALADVVFDPEKMAESEIYLEAALKGKLDQLEGVEIHRRWSFDFYGDRLEAVSDDDETFLQVYVIRTPDGTGEISAVEYRRDTFVTHRLNPYRVTLSGNRLHIQSPGHYEFKFKGFNRDFTVGQFSEKEAEEIQYHLWLYHDIQFAQELCLYIPADVNIEHDPAGISLVVIDEE
ncbi:MAG: hypothetical protein WBK24_00580 [Dethiobacteria bacterium]